MTSLQRRSLGELGFYSSSGSFVCSLVVLFLKVFPVSHFITPCKALLVYCSIGNGCGAGAGGRGRGMGIVPVPAVFMSTPLSVLPLPEPPVVGVLPA